MGFKEWDKVFLSDIMDIIGGGTPKTTVEGYWNGHINWISVKDFNGGRKYITNTEKTITELGLNKSSTKLLQKKDIIISARGTVGALGMISKPMAFNQSCYGLRAKSHINSDFLFYLLKNSILVLQNNTHGSVFNTITRTTFDTIEVKVPPLNEQKAIADILSSLDDKIELNNQMNETLEEMAQALFKRWFVDFEFPNEEGKPYKSSGGEMVESELGMIPKGWDITILDNICSLMTKSVKPFDNPEVLYEHFSLPACDEGKLPVIEFGNQISSNKYMINNSCILISKLNPVTKRIWDPVCKENSICSTEFMVYQPKNLGIKPFCYELINSYRFTEYLLCNVTGSTGSRQRVQPKLTLKYQFAISSRILIEQFSDLVKPMHDKVKVNIEENRILKKTRDSLLPKLMSGEIRVSDLKS